MHDDRCLYLFLFCTLLLLRVVTVDQLTQESGQNNPDKVSLPHHRLIPAHFVGRPTDVFFLFICGNRRSDDDDDNNNKACIYSSASREKQKRERNGETEGNENEKFHVSR